MKANLLFFLLFVNTLATLGQSTFNKQTISSAGEKSSNADFSFTWSLGELSVGTISGTNVVLLQGYAPVSMAIPAAPVAIPASSILQTNFTANWNSSATATGYKLDVALDNGFASFVSGYNDKDVSNTTNYSVIGLTPNTNYYFRIRAYNSGGTSTSSNTINPTTLPNVPSAPLATSATSILQTSFSTNWNSASTATGYKLDVASDNLFTTIISGLNDKDVSNVTTFSVTGLTANSTYYYRVRAYNTGGSSSNSGTITVSTLPNPPSAPTSNPATNILQTTLTANWSSSANATGYRLDIALDNLFTSILAGYNDKDVNNVILVNITGLSANTNYYYRVRAYNSGGVSSNSGTISAGTLPNPPSAPTANPATTILQTGFTANWNSSATAMGYKLDVALDNGFTSFVSGYNDKDVSNTTNYSVIGLTANTNYYYRVRAYNSGGTSTSSGTINPTTLPNVPSAPAASAATNILQTTFTANWNTSATATGYKLDVSSDNLFTTLISGFSDRDVSNVTTFSVTGLTANTTYYYRVRAYNSGGASSNSGTITISTLPNPPSAPVANAQSNVLQTSFTANWSVSASATGYRLDVASDNLFTTMLAGYSDKDVTNLILYNITGLSANTSYYYRVRAYNTGGVSSNSGTIYAVTLPNAPSAPTFSAATSILQTSFSANWSSSPTATGYKIDVATDAGFTSFVSGFSDKDVNNVTTYNISGLSANTQYYYRVRAYNTGGTSLSSGVFNPTTLPNVPSAPTANSATTILQTSFNANWTTSATATGYRLDVATNIGFTTLVSGYSDRDVSNVTTFNITGLSPASTYYYRVRAYNTGGTSSSSSIITTTTLPDPPTAPVASSASNIFQTSFTANWISSANATGYKLDVATDNLFSLLLASYSDKDVSNVTVYSVTGLTANTTYYYRVRAYNTGGSSSNSATIAPLTLPNAPSVPAAGSATNLAQTSFTANWSSSASATGYQLDVATDNGFTSLVSGYSNKDVNNVTNYGISGLSANTIYYYRIRAYNTGGTSSNSGTISTSTLPNAPASPTASAATGILQASFTANWGAISNATGYRLDVSTDNSFASFISGYNDKDVGNLTSYGLSGLTANTTYYYRIRAYNTGGSSANSGIITTITIANIPAAPTANSASNILQTGFTANWTVSATSTGYRLDVSTDNGFTSFFSGYNDKDVSNVTSYSISGLIANSTYYYRIRAYNSGGTGPNSVTISATTSALPSPPSVPVANQASNITSTSLDANWNSSASATGYRIDVSSNNSFSSFFSSFANKDIGNVTTITVSGLTSNSTYYYRLRAYNSDGTSSNSGIISATTLPDPPPAPVSVSASNISQTGLTANWNISSTATGYQVDVATDNGFTSFVTGYSNKDAGNVTNLAVSGLNANATYYYRVRAYNTGGVSSYSNPITSTTLPDPPQVPTANSADNIVQIGFSANWSASLSATGYFIDVAIDNAFTSFVTGYNNKDVGNVLTAGIAGLSPNTAYYYRIRAYRSTGTSSSSSVITATTLPNSPSAPIASAATVILQTSFTANWTSSSTAASYRFDLAFDNGFSSFVTGYNNKDVGNVLLLNTSGLSPNTTYYFRVRAHNTGGTSNSSNIITTLTLPDPPAAPFANGADNILQTNFTAKWTISTTAAGYFLDVATDAGFTSFVTGYNNKDIGNFTSSGLTGLNPNTTYYYRVRAYGAGGSSSNSNTISVSTLPNVPAAPNASSATNITQGSFAANWTLSATATGYRIDVSTDNAFSSLVTGYNDKDVGNSTTVIVSGLNTYTSYYYRVRAYNSAGTSTSSGTIPVKTLTSPPDVLTGLTSLSCNNLVTLSWKKNTNPYFTRYRIYGGTTANPATKIDSTSNGISDTLKVISGLTKGQTYFFRVSAVNIDGPESSFSTQISETVKTGVIPRIRSKWNNILICSNIGDSITAFQWYKGISAIGSAINQYYSTNKQPGIYFLETVDKNGCKNSSKTITIAGSKSLSVYPNPASVSFAVKINDETEGRAVVSIIDTAGLKVMEFQVENMSDELLKSIPVNNLSEGIYIVQVLLNHKDLYYGKIIVTK